MRATTTLACILALVPTGFVSSQTLEITPFYGFAATEIGDDDADHRRYGHDEYGSGGRIGDRIDIDDDALAGLALALGITRSTQIELLYSRQSTTYRDTTLDETFDLDLDYAHVGVVYRWSFDRIEPFVVGSVGTTRIHTGLAPADDVFSISGGGGIKLMFNERLGVRFAGRLFVSAIEESDALLCPAGACSRDGDEALAEFDLSAGLVLRFGRRTASRSTHRTP